MRTLSLAYVLLILCIAAPAAFAATPAAPAPVSMEPAAEGCGSAVEQNQTAFQTPVISLAERSLELSGPLFAPLTDCTCFFVCDPCICFSCDTAQCESCCTFCTG